MENQHRKISGYRELSQEEIDLMNEIKAKGREIVELQKRISEMQIGDMDDDVWAEMQNQRSTWAYQAGINIETGVMQLVRAVALPT